MQTTSRPETRRRRALRRLAAREEAERISTERELALLAHLTENQARAWVRAHRYDQP